MNSRYSASRHPLPVLVTLSAILNLSLTATLSAAVPVVPTAAPAEVGMNATRLSKIDVVVAEGLRRKWMPGCVVMVGHQGKIVFHKAYGNKQVQPETIAMTTDTVFDMASITKPIATATSVMKLVELGKIDVDQTVAHYIPEFAANGKDEITVRQLLIHQGGLLPDNALSDYNDGVAKAFERIYALGTRVEPGTTFMYSDVGFIVLAKLVERVSGKNVHQFSQEFLFKPLGMQETGYNPPAALRKRAATTQQREGRWMRGEVHDPRAYRLDGIAGHAGLFSTSSDLARFAQMLLGQGTYQDNQILAAETVALMTKPNKVSSGLRGLGWDIRTGYSYNRGDLLTDQAFGHGGFTGTTFWVDPGQELFVIFLSNRVHPDGSGSVNRLAGRIATIATAAISTDKEIGPATQVGDTLSGLDVLQRDQYQQLQGKRIGLITNHTGINRDGVSIVELFNTAANVDLVALFSPEHGFEGKLDVAKIKDAQDAKSGLKIYSLYGKTRKPTAEMLADIDLLVFDIQDIGTRFYTYISTMGNAMQAAADHDIDFMVLDRPNPINGAHVQGPVLDKGSESFVGFHPVAVRHGMTAGELANMFNVELDLKLNLQIIKLAGWHRSNFFDATGLPWVNPSPNMRNLNQALLYPGIGLLETTNLSVGRGTDTPFEQIGAPYIQGRELANVMNARKLNGIRFVPIQFTPESSKFSGQVCGGLSLVITDRDVFDPLATG
ncbi:MAG: exo-beta-N-acetylmuramidase NamZ domain-containing protein, partial [Pirellulaceae bacterium]